MRLMRSGRELFLQCLGRSKAVFEVTQLCFIVGLCGCEIPNILPSEMKNEQWRLLGIMHSRRFPFPQKPVDDWIAVWGFPGGKVRRIISTHHPYPDGSKPIASSSPLAYNEAAQVVVLWDSTSQFQDVWVNHLRSKQGKWIGRKRWRNIGKFAWSKDGRRLAFTASDVLRIGGEHRRASVYIYDVTTHKLTEVADDATVRATPMRTPSPVWSKDGKYLYYTSIESDLTRVELATHRKEKLPVKADAILTVRGNEIVYWRCIPARIGRGTERLVIKSTLDPVQGESDVVVVYEGWDLQETTISPTGRFILTVDRCGWEAATVLIDTETLKSYRRVYNHLPFGFTFYATSFSGPTGE